MIGDAKPEFAKVYKVRVYKDKAGKHRWRMTAPNGKIVADSAESYATKSGADKAAWRAAEAIIIVAGELPK